MSIRWFGWFFIGNAILFAAIGLRYIGWITPDNYQAINAIYLGLTWLFIVVTLIGHFALLAFLALLPVFILVLITSKRWVIIPIASIFAACAAFLLITDTIVFAQYRFHLNGIFAEMFFSDATNEIFNFTRQEYFTAISIFSGLLLLEIAYGIWLWRRLVRLSTGLRIYIGLGTCLITSWLLFLLSSIQPAYSGLAQQPQAFPLYNTILSRLLPIANSLQALETVGQTQFAQPTQLAKNLQYPLAPLQCAIPAKPLNIVMIVVDSWRFDMLNAQVTPHMMAFSKNATRYLQHYSGGNATQPGIFSLLYGMPGTYWTAMLQQKRGPVLIDTLQKAGYQMGVFGSAKLSNPAFDSTVFKDVPELALNTPGDTPVQRDRHITSEFKSFIQQKKVNKTQKPKPFFTFLFYDGAHSYCAPPYASQPFSPIVKECNRALFTKQSDPRPYFNRYKNALYQVDQQVGEVLETLKQQGLLSNTVVILTSDHGEEFDDTKQGYIGHASNFTDVQVRVPFVVWWPWSVIASAAKQSILASSITSHYDVPYLLLSGVLGCKNPASDYTTGASSQQYLQMTSYVNFGIRQADRITTVFRTGNFKVDDLQGKPLPDTMLDKAAIQSVFEMMNRFYHDKS